MWIKWSKSLFNFILQQIHFELIHSAILAPSKEHYILTVIWLISLLICMHFETHLFRQFNGIFFNFWIEFFNCFFIIQCRIPLKTRFSIHGYEENQAWNPLAINNEVQITSRHGKILHAILIFCVMKYKKCIFAWYY